jgi:hypothetical protein
MPKSFKTAVNQGQSSNRILDSIKILTCTPANEIEAVALVKRALTTYSTLDTSAPVALRRLVRELDKTYEIEKISVYMPGTTAQIDPGTATSGCKFVTLFGAPKANDAIWEQEDSSILSDEEEEEGEGRDLASLITAVAGKVSRKPPSGGGAHELLKFSVSHAGHTVEANKLLYEGTLLQIPFGISQNLSITMDDSTRFMLPSFTRGNRPRAGVKNPNRRILVVVDCKLNPKDLTTLPKNCSEQMMASFQDKLAAVTPKT